jgi:hypothetical protein
MIVARNHSLTDRASSAAIFQEMGDRLRVILGRTTRRLPQHMLDLVKRMAITEPVTPRLDSKPEVTP